MLDRDGYVHYDLKNKVVKQNIEAKAGDGLDLTGDDAATAVHMDNFVDAIRSGDTLRAPIDDGGEERAPLPPRQHRAIHGSRAQDGSEELDTSWAMRRRRDTGRASTRRLDADRVRR